MANCTRNSPVEYNPDSKELPEIFHPATAPMRKDVSTSFTGARRRPKFQEGQETANAVPVGTQWSDQSEDQQEDPTLPARGLPTSDSPTYFPEYDGTNFVNSAILYHPVFDAVVKTSASNSSSTTSGCLSSEMFLGSDDSNNNLKEFGQSSSEVLRTFDFWAASCSNVTAEMNQKPSEILQNRANRICTYQMNPIIAARALARPSRSNLLNEFLENLKHLDFVPMEFHENMQTNIFRKLLPPSSTLEQALVESIEQKQDISIDSYHGWLTKEYIKKFINEVRKQQESKESSVGWVFNKLKTTLTSAFGFLVNDSISQSFWLENEQQQQQANRNRSIKESPARNPHYCNDQRLVTTFPCGDKESRCTTVGKYPKQIDLYALAGVHQLPRNLRVPVNKPDVNKMKNRKPKVQTAETVPPGDQHGIKSIATPVTTSAHSVESPKKEIEFLVHPRKNVGVVVTGTSKRNRRSHLVKCNNSLQAAGQQ